MVQLQFSVMVYAKGAILTKHNIYNRYIYIRSVAFTLSIYLRAHYQVKLLTFIVDACETLCSLRPKRDTHGVTLLLCLACSFTSALQLPSLSTIVVINLSFSIVQVLNFMFVDNALIFSLKLMSLYLFL